jgi:hypothetical protein
VADQQRRRCQSRVRSNSKQDAILTITIRDKEGRTPLHYAAKVSKPLAYKLIQQDANVNARARNGMTPLHCAFQSQQLDIVVLLLNSGADIATRDNEKRLPTDLATELFVNEVHRRTRRRYMTADEMSAQASEEEVHESAHVAEDIEEPVVTRVKPRSSPRKQHAPEDDVSAQEEIELLRSALRDAQRALEQSNSKQMQQAITLYKQAALTRKAEVESMAVRMRELEAELHARDVEIRELKRRIEDMRANQRMSRGNTPAKRRRSTSQSPRPNKRRRVSGRQQSREEEEEEEDEEEDEAGEVAEQVEDKNAASEDNPSEDEAGEKRQTPNVRTRSASKQTSSAKKSPRENKSPTQSRSTPKSAKQQPKSAKQQPKQASSASSEEESAGESQSSSTSSSESAKASKKASDKSKEKNAKNRKSDASKTVEVSIVGERNRAGK